MMERLLGWDLNPDFAGLVRRQGTPQPFYPGFEVKETKDAFLFKADVPGIRDSDLEISLSGNQLTISGYRKEEQEEEVQNYFLYERSYGKFVRTFTLPEGADIEHIRAELKDGVLDLIVPKRPEVQPRRIELGTTPGSEKKPKA
jgi:HSP20 family protein